MSTDVRVPTTGNAGEDVVIVGWNVAEGAEVSAGDVLVVLETAKSTIDVEAPASGRLLKIRFAAGDEVPEHEVLAIIGAANEAVRSDAAPVVAPTPGRLAVSPRARVLAERNGVALSALRGSGPGGRIIVGDVLMARSAPPSKPAPAAVPAPVRAPVQTAPADTTARPATPPPANDVTVVPVRGARKVTAQRMHGALQSTAQVTLTRYADATALLAYVRRLRVATEASSLPKIGINDVVLYASARAVAKHPEANSWFSWEGISQFRSVNLGFAVDTGQSLLVPVIADAATLSLGEIAAAARASIEKAKSGRLTTAEMEGGTFTVSNLGSLGVHWFTPVLNPPQSCILGVGATHQLHPDGPSLLPLSLTFDHRALDGAAAAGVLASIVSAIETADLLAAF
jgi:pyruvate dehydrogenase E2 component (dihydrolipoamide acetyltransferase)